MYEIGGIICLGILAQWVAWRLKVPAILPLIIVGLAVGPLAEFWWGQKLINPVFDPDANYGLFPGKTMFYFVSLSIGIILFEGGLTLNRREVKGLSGSIINLVTVGALITFIGGTLATRFILGLSWQISFLFSSLIIVTGPTVIAPILRNLKLKREVSTILKWEGIIIDPVGAFVAVLVFNYISFSIDPEHVGTDALLNFLRSALVGLGLGVILGYGLYWLIKNLVIPHYLLAVSTLALVIGAFMLSDFLAHESGLLTVVVLGMTLGNLNVPHFKEILNFKESISILLISILFILLSANMTVEQLLLVANWRVMALFFVLILVVRPIAVFVSMMRSDLGWRDKAFVSWVGPRGIVAAGVASLFGIQLEELGVDGAEMITPLVFLVVMGTVFLNATTAGVVGKRVRVTLQGAGGILIIGANEGARLIGSYLHKNGRRVVMIDTSKTNIEEAREAGLDAIQANIYDQDLEDSLELTDVGYILAISGSDEVNFYALNRFREDMAEEGAYRLISKKETQNRSAGPETLFSINATYLALNRMARQNLEIHEVIIQSKEELERIISWLGPTTGIPLFIVQMDGKINAVLAEQEHPPLQPGETLVYIGAEAPKDLFENLEEKTPDEAEEVPPEEAEGYLGA